MLTSGAKRCCQPSSTSIDMAATIAAGSIETFTGGRRGKRNRKIKMEDGECRKIWVLAMIRTKQMTNAC